MEKIAIGGMKLSPELALITLQHPPDLESRGCRLWEKLTASRINILYLSRLCSAELYETSFCVAAEDAYSARELLQSENLLNGYVSFVPSVGALSLFPHQFSFEILGLALYSFGKAEIPFYGLASSISSLTFITDYEQLDQCAAAMEEYLSLPPGQVPMK